MRQFFAVTSVILTPGGLRIWISGSGPKPACSGPYRLFTGTGQPVTDNTPSGGVGEASVPELGDGDVFTMHLDLQLTHIDGRDANITDQRIRGKR